jgi:hypothetical protein
MLKPRYLLALGALIPIFAGCGTEQGTSTASDDDARSGDEVAAECDLASQDPQVLGDAESVRLTLSVGTTVETVNAWLAEEAKIGGGPQETLDVFEVFSDLGPSATMTTCLFQGDPRPIPGGPGGPDGPSEAKSVADGVATFVQGEVVVVYAFGPLEGLTSQVERLETMARK